MRNGFLSIIVLIVGLSLSPTDGYAKNYARNREAVDHMTALSYREKMDFNYLSRLLMAIQRDDDVLKKISKPAEKTKPWFEYRQIFHDEARIAGGIDFYRNHYWWLKKAQEEYGVDPSIIVAIIGVETRYGTVTGDTPVLTALATLCFDYPPRADFFCGELDRFLILAQRENWNPLQIKGSYAGAMGMAQFMPNSYLNDAVDFDGDGRVDLWGSPADAIGSIARYLKNRQWEKDGQLVYPLTSPLTHPHFGESHKPHIPAEDLMNGNSLKNDQKFMKWLGLNQRKNLGTLILQGEKGSLYWLTDNNFYVVTRYNSSPMYAMAVIELAESINQKINTQIP